MTRTKPQPAACVAVFEQHPYWGPELQRQLHSYNLMVCECRSLKDLTAALEKYSAGVALLDLDSSPIDCLAWLDHYSRSTHRRPVIACVSLELMALEWTLREAGSIGFVTVGTSGQKLARLCLRQLRLP